MELTVGVDGERVPRDLLGENRVLQELLCQDRVLARGHQPTNDVAAEDVEHRVEVMEETAARTVEFGVGVGPERPANISAGGSLRPALRTGRATLTASGSPRSYAIVTADPDCVIVHGVRMRAPRNR
jgi:hypothetical protein